MVMKGIWEKAKCFILIDLPVLIENQMPKPHTEICFLKEKPHHLFFEPLEIMSSHPPGEMYVMWLLVSAASGWSQGPPGSLRSAH